ncbi:MAG: hypothetical protein DRG25_02440 [Deltaproteobacteria bacterium]|nr:MAG: hypothetical protein DRG25_02440 [Deltaproteobacteria bacterium]
MQMLNEQFFHDLIIHEVKERYSKIHKEVHINPGEERNFEIQGLYPDIIFGGYGQIIQIIEVETEGNLNKERASYWEKLANTGIPFTILVAKRNQKVLTDLLWKVGLMAKVKVATFEITFGNL